MFYNLHCYFSTLALFPTDIQKTNQKIPKEGKHSREYDDHFQSVYHDKVETIISLISKSESLKKRVN